MAKKISGMDAAAAFDGTELVEVVQAGANRKGATGAFLPPGYIDGLKLKWVSGTALTVTTGAAYIKGLGRVLRVGADIAKAGLTLAANSWHHVYLFQGAGGAADIEIVATAPAAPYSGTARAKTADDSRRYLGSVKTDGSGQVLQFVVDSSGYFRHTAGAIRCLANGKATARTPASLSAAVPVTATAVLLTAINSDSAVLCNLGYASAISANGGFFGLAPVASSPGPIFIWTTDGNQNVDYAYNAAPTNGLYIDVLGFCVER
jgi:hypothetical protein